MKEKVKRVNPIPGASENTIIWLILFCAPFISLQQCVLKQNKPNNAKLSKGHIVQGE